MGASRKRPRRVEPDPASMFESLEPRVHLSAFAYLPVDHYLGQPGPLYTLRPAGEQAPARSFASSVAAAGDIDGDGVPDILVGSGGVASDGGATDAVAAVYSGKNGQLLLTFRDGFSEFGSAVAGIGDVNGDGVPDLLVGSPAANGNAGRAYIYSGADGELLHTLSGQNPQDRFGSAVAGVGDVSGDGVPDVIVGAPGAGGQSRGAAYIFSGADGSLIRTLTGVFDQGLFGFSVAGAGDINGDGRADVIVGAPGPATGSGGIAGMVMVFSGANGQVLHTFTGVQGGERFGFAVAGGSDITGDGVRDIVVGAPRYDVPGTGVVPNAGRVVVFSGASGEEVRTFLGDRPVGNLGAAVAFAGDVNSDGRVDLLVGQPSAGPDARIIVYSGASGAVIGQYVARDAGLVGSDRLGTAVASLGDITGDGVPDFIFAGTQDANPDRGDRSRSYVFSGAQLLELMPTGINDSMAVWGVTQGQGFLVLDGDFFVLPSRGFSRGDFVIDVNSSNVVVGGRDIEGRAPFIWEDGVRRTIPSIIHTYDGPAGDYVNMRVVDITDSGLILLERIDADENLTTWLLEDGTLRYLFDGSAVMMNESRTVVGRTAWQELDSIIWTPQSGPVLIPNFGANDINEAGVIAGSARTQAGPMPAIWTGGVNGSLTVLPAISGGSRFFPHSINEWGWMVGRYTTAQDTISGFIYNPELGVASDIRDFLAPGTPEAVFQSDHLRLSKINNEGIIVARSLDNGQGGVVTVLGRGPVRALSGAPILASEPGTNRLTAVTLNLASELLAFQRDPQTGAWTAVNLAGAAGAPRASEATTFTDPRSGRTAYAAVAEDGLYLITDLGGGQWSVRNLTQETAGAGATPIVRGLTDFTSVDGVAYIAGIDAAGDVVVYTQTGQTSGGQAVWRYENLSELYLRPHNFQTPEYVGGLVSYVTSWNGLNIAGLDADGAIWTVWTSGELAGRWESTNLSQITGAPPLVGGLAPFLAPWGAIHIAGTDARGDTVATWWVPGFEGNWEKNNLTEEYEFVRLRPETVSSYVTAWGALNILGLDDEGRTSIYWWVPETNTWLLTHLDLERPDPRIRPVGRLDGFAGSEHSMSLFAAGPHGEVLRMHWRPDQPWLFENLSAAVFA